MIFIDKEKLYFSIFKSKVKFEIVKYIWERDVGDVIIEVSKIAKRFDVTKTTVVNHLRWLEDNGILIHEFKIKGIGKSARAVNSRHINPSVKKEIDKIMKNLQEDP